MQDFINISMLACATAASLAFGVLVAQATCRVAFSLLRMHATSVANERIEKASVASEARA
jgi:accessory gene regulator protein AgrB